MIDALKNLRQGMSYEEVAAVFGGEGDLKNQGTYSNEWKDYKKITLCIFRTMTASTI
ncbi:hypothetical protein ACFU6E_27900 [Bacillus cereus]|uniref:hypothetical protein n=2 Tax=Bacillus TaxID=1386 RepID=UPI003671842A